MSDIFREGRYVVEIMHNGESGYLSKRYYKHKNSKRVGGWEKKVIVNKEIITPYLHKAARFNSRDTALNQIAYLKFEIVKVSKIIHTLEILD